MGFTSSIDSAVGMLHYVKTEKNRGLKNLEDVVKSLSTVSDPKVAQAIKDIQTVIDYLSPL